MFLRKAIEEIVDSEFGALEDSDLYNLRENTSISDVAELIRKLTTERWLAPSAVTLETASLTLGPRTFLELIAFLRDLDVKKCAICTYEMLQGVSCKQSGCSTALHSTCLATFENKGLQFKCPACKHRMRA